MESNNLEIRQLQYFVAVAELKSFSRAAEMLYVTQPLLSQQISALEQQLDTQLFLRQRKALKLTSAGAALYKEAKNILADSVHLVHSVKNALLYENEGLLHIGYEDLFDWPFCNEAIFRFQKENPSAVLKSHWQTQKEVLSKLFAGEYDIVFVLTPAKSLSSTLNTRVIGKTQLCLGCGRAQTEDLSQDEFLRLMDQKPLILINGDNRNTNSAIQICGKLNSSPQFHFLNCVQDVITNIATGNGLALFPKSVFDLYGGGCIRVESLPEGTASELCMVAAWLSTNLNPQIPRLLSFFEDFSEDCIGCKLGCSCKK